MVIRPVEVSDSKEWQRLRVALYSDPDPLEITHWFETRANGGTPLVGEEVIVADRGNGQLAGFVEVGSRNYAEGCVSSPVAYLEGWYVDPEFRRAGLGTRLFEAAEAWARQNGYTEMGSDAEFGNSISEQAHASLGFTEVERQICFRKSLL